MSLKNTEKKLYDPKSEIEKREHSASVFDLDYKDEKSEIADKFSANKSWWNNLPFLRLNFETRAVVYFGGIILAVIATIAGLVVGIYKFRQTAFSEDRVKISISGDTIVDSTKSIEYFIECENNNRTKLKNVEVILNYPENFYPEESEVLKRISDRSSKILVGDMKSHSKKRIKISGKFYAAENHTVYLRATMNYAPINFSSIFQVESQISVRVANSPIELNILTPKKALSESPIEYEVIYKNKGTVLLKNLTLRVNYPAGFIYQGATLHPIAKIENGNLWHLGDLDAGSEGRLKIKGKVSGNRYDSKLIKVTIFKSGNDEKEIVYSKAEGLTKIVVSPLVISHKINEQSFLNANLSDVLTYKINYANNGDKNLRDIIIKLKIDSPIIDYQKIKLDKGAFQSATKNIIWKASDIEGLQNMEPGAKGVIDLQIPLKENIELQSFNDKNFVIKSVVTIDSSDIVFNSLGTSKNISNEVIVKLNSRVNLNTDIYYNDNLIKNSGPLPPKVGKETTYTIHWKINNLSNDISETQVSAYLPTGIRWMGKISPQGENLTFNERTHEVVWKVGNLSAGVGYLSPARECAFQIGIVPEINQINQAVDLLSETVLTSKDNFTSVNTVVKNEIRTTRINSDKDVKKYEYLVAE